MWEGAIVQNGLVHEVQIYKDKQGIRTGALVVQDLTKQKERKILHVYIDFFSFYLFLLFYFIF